MSNLILIVWSLVVFVTGILLGRLSTVWEVVKDPFRIDGGNDE